MASPEEDHLFGDKELEEETLNTQGTADNSPLPQGTAGDVPLPLPQYDQQERRLSGWDAFLAQQVARVKRSQGAGGARGAGGLQQHAHGQDETPIDPQLEAYTQQLSSELGDLPQPAQQQQEDYDPTADPDLTALEDEWHNDLYGNADLDPMENFDAQAQYDGSNAQVRPAATFGPPDAGNHDGQQHTPVLSSPIPGVDVSLWGPLPPSSIPDGNESLKSTISAYLRDSPARPAPSAVPVNWDRQANMFTGHQSNQQVIGADVIPGDFIQQPQYGNQQLNLNNEAQNGQTGVSQQPHHQNQQYTSSQAAPGGVDGHFNPANQQFNQNQGTQNSQTDAFQQQLYHDNQQFTGSHAVSVTANGHFDAQNTQYNQNVGTHNGQGGTVQQAYPDPPNQQYPGSQAVPKIVIHQTQSQVENQQVAGPQGAPTGVGGYMYPDPPQQPVNQFDNGQNDLWGAANQNDNTYQQFGGPQTGREQGNTGEQFNNNEGQQFNIEQTQGNGGDGDQYNNGNQQFNNGKYQYGLQDAAIDLLNLGGAQADQVQGTMGGQFNNGDQLFNNNNNNNQYGHEDAAVDLLNLGGVQAVHGVGAGQFNNQGQQQPNNGQTAQAGTAGFSNNNSTNNQHQQLDGAQTGQGVGGPQYNYGSQQPSPQSSRVPTPQGGLGNYLAPNQSNNGNQQPSRTATPQAPQGGVGRYLAPETNQPDQPNNESQQPSRVLTPQGGNGGYLAPGHEPLNQNNGVQYGQGVTSGQSNNGSQQPSRVPTPRGGMGGYLTPANQPLNQNTGMQNNQGGAGGYLDPGHQQFNNQQPQQGATGGYLNPVQNNNQQAGFSNAAGGNNQYLQPKNQQPAGPLYGGGGSVAQPVSGIQGQQFAASPYGAPSPLHPGTQPPSAHGSVSPLSVQNSNVGTPNPDQPPAVGSASPEPRPPPVVTPPVFPAGTPQPDSWVAPGSGNEVVKIRAPKVRTQHDIHPHSVYYYPTQTAPWGTEIHEQTGRPGPTLFPYSNSQPQARAELVASKVYTAKQLSIFFRGDGHPNLANRHLTIWIQNVPLIVSDRYAQKDAGKCRYVNCAAKPNYTILKGFHRVAFDEHSHHTGDWYDPYNNAGYMHLWCFEQAFDFGYLVWDVQERPHLYNNFRIEADVRHHRFEEQNKASLNRDHNLHDTFGGWKNEQWDRYVRLRHQEAATGIRYDPAQTVDGMENDNRLWRRLTDKHIADEVPARARNRANRSAGGNTIDNHRGDLELYIRVDKEKKGGGKNPSTPKRKRGNGNDDDSEEETPASKRSRTIAAAAAANNSMVMPPPSTPRRTTRRSAMALAHNLEAQLGTVSQSPLTRSRATFLGQQLNQLPAHLQQDVITHALVPQSGGSGGSAMQAISPLLLLQNWKPENWGEVLRERVGRMTPYHQGLLVGFVERMEKKMKEGVEGRRRWRSDP